LPSTSIHVNLDGHADTSFFLLGRQEVQPLEADDSPLAIPHQHHIVVRLFADVFVLRIVEPDAQCVAFAVKVDPQLVRSSFPFLMFFVRYPG
jgi:hypothetical protein